MPLLAPRILKAGSALGWDMKGKQIVVSIHRQSYVALCQLDSSVSSPLKETKAFI